MSVLDIVQTVRIVALVAGLIFGVWVFCSMVFFGPYSYRLYHWFGRFRR